MKYLVARQLYRARQSRDQLSAEKEELNGKYGHLPFELICNIVAHLDEERNAHHAPWLFTKTVLQPALFTLTQVDKRWNEAAMEFLYKDVFIASARSLSRLSLTLFNHKHLRPRIRSIFFTRAYIGSGHEWRTFGDWWDLERIHSLCPNVKSWTSKTRGTPSSRLPRRLLIREIRHHLLLRRKLGIDTLTRLELQAFNCAPDIYFPATLSFPVLEDLVLKDFTYEVTSGDNRLEWPDMPCLRRLCLFQCSFINDSLSFPAVTPGKPSLRALEIVGGYYIEEDIWEKMIAIGQSLEILTMAPEGTYTVPTGDKLLYLPSLVMLRIPVSHFVEHLGTNNVPRPLPPRLVHLVMFETPSSSNFGILETQDCVKWLVDQKRSGNGELECRDLETIRVNGKVSKVARERQIHLSEEAEKVGISFTLFNSSSVLAIGLSAIGHWLSPVF